MVSGFWTDIHVEYCAQTQLNDVALLFQRIALCLQVKQLYKGLLGKMRGLHPGWRGTAGGKLEGLERQVEQEMSRRKSLGTQLAQLLDSQLQILRAQLIPQHDVHKSFAASLRECFRLLALLSDTQASLWDKHIQQWYVCI